MADWTQDVTCTVGDCKPGLLIEEGIGGPDYPPGRVASARRALGRSHYCGCEIRTERDEWGDVRPLQCHHENARQARNEAWSRAMKAYNEAKAAARPRDEFVPRGTFTVVAGVVHMTPFEPAQPPAPDRSRERRIAEATRRHLVKEALFAAWELFECIEPLAIAGYHRIKGTPEGKLALDALLTCGVFRQTPGFYPTLNPGRRHNEPAVKAEIERLAYERHPDPID